MYTQKTMILPAAVAPLARSLAYAMAGEAAAGMWTVGLSADGVEATHYIPGWLAACGIRWAATHSPAAWPAAWTVQA